MRTPSNYLSEHFIKNIWPDFSIKLLNKRTRENYFSIVCMICDYAKVDFLDLTHQQVKSYFDSLTVPKSNRKRLSYKTVQSRLSALRSISTFILENRNRYNVPETYINVFLYVDVPEYSEYISKEDIPTIKELDNILVAASDNPMMYLIFALVIRCALTASEVCNLKETHISEDKANRFFILFEENNRVRYVKIPEDVVPSLISYMKQTNRAGEYLFYNQRGLVLKVRNLQSLVKKYVNMAGIEKDYTIQDIRNAAICYMKAFGADDLSTAEYVGVEGRWMYRYDKVIHEIDLQPVDLVKIQIK